MFMELCLESMRARTEQEIKTIFSEVRNTTKEPLRWAHIKAAIDRTPGKAWKQYRAERDAEQPHVVNSEQRAANRQAIAKKMAELADRMRAKSKAKKLELTPDDEARLRRVDEKHGRDYRPGGNF